MKKLIVIVFAVVAIFLFVGAAVFLYTKSVKTNSNPPQGTYMQSNEQSPKPTPNAPQTQEDLKMKRCETCNNTPSKESREQCRAALGCE